MAHTAEVYAKRQKLSNEVSGYAHEIKLDAMARLGEFLEQSPKATGGEHGGKAKLDGSREAPSNATPTLAEAGLSKKESATAQLVAKIKKTRPKDLGERRVAKAMRAAALSELLLWAS